VSACVIEGCARPTKTRGWCGAHYEKWRTTGDPTSGRVYASVLRPRTTMGRFWSKVRADHTTGCWNWTGSTQASGHGRLTVEGKQHAAYRFLYEQLVAPIPAGLELDHLCNNPRCVNPDHLEPVTPDENKRRFRSIQAAEMGARTTCIRGHERAIYERTRDGGSNYCIECAREIAAAKRREVSA